MKLTSRIMMRMKAMTQLGVDQVGLYGLYQLGLRTGHYRRQLSASLSRLHALDYKGIKLQPYLPGLPDPGVMHTLLKDQVGQLYEQADEIVDGKIRLFGGPPVPMVLELAGPLEEWIDYEFMDGRVDGQDIKSIWEPARFGWACTLAMAYHLSQKESYAKAFWRYTEEFLARNPPYKGPHWCSAQEVAIRLVALAFALQVFAQPGLATEDQLEKVARSIAIHAERIPPTLVYARSQNNNHLITEALGLYTASVMLPDHPQAARWHDLGWHWLMDALQAQIDPSGTYTQHSTNYHRLMLQAAIWAYCTSHQSSEQKPLTPGLLSHLTASTRWLSTMVDPKAGCVPNFGHNDGAYILPLTVCPYQDYRPVLHAAMQIFMHTDLQPGGPWKDMSYWLGISGQPASTAVDIDSSHKQLARQDIEAHPPYILVNQNSESWAVIHAAQYNSRPAHADQLHLDLWWHGLNLAMDPGTYLYNAPFPWENSLASAFVHNTITVDGREFMQRAGRFLYLDWAQATVLYSRYDPITESHVLTASHDGYQKLGLTHTRTVSTLEDGNWEVEDRLEGPAGQRHSIRLHWLLPDWEYEVQDLSKNPNLPGFGITLMSPICKFTLQAGVVGEKNQSDQLDGINFQLARAGELIAGSGSVLPIAGYSSPTYGVKVPALAYILEVKTALPLTLKSRFLLPRPRAAVIVIKNGQVALIERHRSGKHYFVFAGGKLETGETAQMAAARESREELGLEVNIGRLVASIWFQGRPQYYFLAEETGGILGQGTDPVMHSPPGSPRGTYQPTWMPIDELPHQVVLPEVIADLVWKSLQAGWPDAPLIIGQPHESEVT